MNAVAESLREKLADLRYANLLEEWYMVKTSSRTKAFSEQEDLFLLIKLLEKDTDCCLEDIKILIN
jgi:hypothetical protein